MSDLREMPFAIEITLVGITAGVLSIPYNSFLLTVITGEWLFSDCLEQQEYDRVSVDADGVQIAVLIDRLFQARICLKNRISTKPE